MFIYTSLYVLSFHNGYRKKTIEHFLLQLQLVLSTATRVRNALEEQMAAVKSLCCHMQPHSVTQHTKNGVQHASTVVRIASGLPTLTLPLRKLHVGFLGFECLLVYRTDIVVACIKAEMVQKIRRIFLCWKLVKFWCRRDLPMRSRRSWKMETPASLSRSLRTHRDGLWGSKVGVTPHSSWVIQHQMTTTGWSCSLYHAKGSCKATRFPTDATVQGRLDGVPDGIIGPPMRLWFAKRNTHRHI